MSNAPAIEVQDLRKSYRNGMFKRSTFDALKGLSLSVGQGEIFGLLGPNGAGKTTFIKVLLGVIRKTGGTAKMFGRTAGTQEARRFVGYLPENLRVRRHHTAVSAMHYYGQLSGLPMSEIKQKRDELLRLVGLTERSKDSVKHYSKGMLQRLGLAQALLHSPRLLMLDEPTDGLDPQARADVRAMLVRLRDQGQTIFLNSHILQEVELICDRVAILDRGVLQYCGSVKEIGLHVTGKSKIESRMIEVRLGVAGEWEPIQAALVNYQIERLPQSITGVTHFKMQVPDQARIDEVIDKIRAAKLSLVSLTKDQITLEAAFLELINQGKADVIDSTIL